MTSLPIYTSIYIHYVSSILNEMRAPIGDSDFVFRITPPLSKVVGPFQSLPEHIYIPIRLNEPLVLKLLPSETYRPFGRYKVEVFRKNQLSSNAVNIMYWTVPLQKDATYQDLVILNPNTPLALGLATSEIISIRPEYPFRLENNIIYWTDEDNKPEPGETVTILTVPYVTLEDLLDEQ